MDCCGPRTGHGTRFGGSCCCCCGQDGGFSRRYLSKEERRQLLDEYRNDLKAELEEVEKRLKSPEAED